MTLTFWQVLGGLAEGAMLGISLCWLYEVVMYGTRFIHELPPRGDRWTLFMSRVMVTLALVFLFLEALLLGSRLK